MALDVDSVTQSQNICESMTVYDRPVGGLLAWDDIARLAFMQLPGRTCRSQRKDQAWSRGGREANDWLIISRNSAILSEGDNLKIAPILHVYSVLG